MNNVDGTADNRSWNCGTEGPSDDPPVTSLRRRQSRNFLVTLMLSQGVPMLLAGDELGRTQQGNNNAYCQDSELSWVDWENSDKDLLTFTSRLIGLRREHPVFRQRRFLDGGRSPETGSGVLPGVAWFNPDGTPVTDADWADESALAFTLFLNGQAIGGTGVAGQPVAGESFLVAFNAWRGPLKWAFPRIADSWIPLLNTDSPLPPLSWGTASYRAPSTFPLAPRSVQLWQAESPLQGMGSMP
jgi:glycogen operon protein